MTKLTKNPINILQLMHCLADRIAAGTSNYLEKKFKSEDFTMHKMLKGFKLAKGNSELSPLLYVDSNRYIPFNTGESKDQLHQLSSIASHYNDLYDPNCEKIYIQVNMIFEKRKKIKAQKKESK